jgi:hypothetical protein
VGKVIISPLGLSECKSRMIVYHMAEQWCTRKDRARGSSGPEEACGRLLREQNTSAGPGARGEALADGAPQLFPPFSSLALVRFAPRFIGLRVAHLGG